MFQCLCFRVCGPRCQCLCLSVCVSVFVTKETVLQIRLTSYFKFVSQVFKHFGYLGHRTAAALIFRTGCPQSPLKNGTTPERGSFWRSGSTQWFFVFHALQHMFNVDLEVVPGKTPQPFDSHGSLAAAWSPPAGEGGRTLGITGYLHQSR